MKYFLLLMLIPLNARLEGMCQEASRAKQASLTLEEKLEEKNLIKGRIDTLASQGKITAANFQEGLEVTRLVSENPNDFPEFCKNTQEASATNWNTVQTRMRAYISLGMHIMQKSKVGADSQK